MEMKVVVFDVEHGASAFIRTPNNYAVLIDCGCTESFSPVLYLAQHELPTVSPWDNRRLTKLVITHPHDDHISDIENVSTKCPPSLLSRQRYNWEEVKVAEAGDYENLDRYATWQNGYYVKPQTLPNYGMDLQHFSLSPDEAKKVNESKYLNNSSMVTVATVTGTIGSRFQEKFLFGGDMETEGWDALLENSAFRAAVKDVDFNIVSHHGHKSGFSEKLFAAIGKKPILNIVSIHHGDEHIDERYGQEAYASGVGSVEKRRMLTTRRDGTITIKVDDEGKYWISTERLKENRPGTAFKPNDLLRALSGLGQNTSRNPW